MELEEWLIARARITSRPHKKITMDDKLSFFHQLATLVNSGTPLLDALQISAEQSQSIGMRDVLEEIASRVAAGCSLHMAAADHPNVFQHHWIEMFRTGETTGKMAMVLNELSKQIAQSRDTRRKITGALTYPLVLIGVAALCLTAMLWLVVPTFASMFHEMGAQLPAITEFVMDASAFVVRYGIFIVIAVFLAVIAFRQYMKTDRGRRRVSAFGLATPLVGELLVQSAMYRFTTNISLLLKSGVPMLETLNALHGIFNRDPLYRDAIANAQERVAAGRPLAESLEDTGLFTGMVTNMVRVGEESAQLAGVMEQLAPYYRERLETMIARMTKLLEPIIIVGMGSAIAVLMMSIYIPMFDMAGKVR